MVWRGVAWRSAALALSVRAPRPGQRRGPAGFPGAAAGAALPGEGAPGEPPQRPRPGPELDLDLDLGPWFGAALMPLKTFRPH